MALKGCGRAGGPEEAWSVPPLGEVGPAAHPSVSGCGVPGMPPHLELGGGALVVVVGDSGGPGGSGVPHYPPGVGGHNPLMGPQCPAGAMARPNAVSSCAVVAVVW